MKDLSIPGAVGSAIIIAVAGVLAHYVTSLFRPLAGHPYLVWFIIYFVLFVVAAFVPSLAIRLGG